MNKAKAKERELLSALKFAKKTRDGLKEDLKKAQIEYDAAEARILEFLESCDAVSTAKYEGLGWAQIQKPRLYANCREESMGELITFLKSQGRGDLVKTTVLPQSLSGFAAECVDAGTALPEFVSYYFKPSVKLYE